MQQAFNATDIHEGSKTRDAGDRPLNDIPDFQERLTSFPASGRDLFPTSLRRETTTFGLERSISVIKTETVSFTQASASRRGPNIHLRTRQERFHTDVDDIAAFDFAPDYTLNRRSGAIRGKQPFPRTQFMRRAPRDLAVRIRTRDPAN